MRTSYAAASGAFAGVLIGIAICLMQEISLPDSIFRCFVLGASGAWMGMLLAWLDQMLTPQNKTNAGDNAKDQHGRVS
ncbi:MAG: hypothetical protein COB41_00890 [Proteobacteria bacterium]|nr:MAG: hypothetical protein COB41_00890 [Pseudomonadota bacterium]